MNNYIIAFWNNDTKQMCNVLYKNCSRTDAINQFNNDCPLNCALVNIIKL